MELSNVSTKFTESIIREMTRVARQHPGCINLAQGFPDFPADDRIKNAAIQAIKDDINQYAITWGSENLRNAISKKVKWFNGIEADPLKNITVTCGATEAMMASLKAIINPGDEIIIFSPWYENYGADCLLSGATPHYVTLHSPNWTYDPDELEKAFNGKTKAIIINSPQNPTGKVFNEKEMKKIANLCLQHDAIAITDEIYEHIIYEGKHISIASLEGMENNSITINSVSKTYSLTGWRVGWAIANAEITKSIKKVHDFLTVGAAAPLQEATAYALSLDKGFYSHLNDFYKNARDTLYNALSKTDLKPIKPSGAYYIMTNCDEFCTKNGLNNSTELALHLIKEYGIATVPGESFYSQPGDGKYQTRFCFCKKEETLNKAIEKLKPLMEN